MRRCQAEFWRKRWTQCGDKATRHVGHIPLCARHANEWADGEDVFLVNGPDGEERWLRLLDDPVRVPCDDCGKGVRRPPAQMERRTRVYCSRTCYRRRHPVACVRCGTVVLRRRSEIRGVGQVHCSVACRWQATMIACVACGARVRRSPSHVLRAAQTFCSPGCHRAWRRATANGGGG